MTTIEKLMVCNVRCFRQEAVIEFDKPLTVIAGTNGAGKTTIIESLKYATTGAYPPGSDNGKAYVLDPKLAGMNTVMAHVKLVFTTYTGKRFLVVRSLKSTQNRGKAPSITALDSVLRTTDEDGNRVDHSKRCSDMNREVPIVMGVSRAILQNVIFCHQEDSNWPLSEPGELKKKFDEIFASSRYTKALVAIQKYRKEQMHKIKELRESCEGWKRLETEAESVRASAEKGKEKLEEVETQLVVLVEQQQQMQVRVSELQSKVKRSTKLRDTIQELKIRKTEIEREAKRVYQGLETEFEEGVDQLRVFLQGFKEELASINGTIANKEKEETLIQRQIVAEKKKLDKVSARVERLQAQHDLHEERVTTFTEVGQAFATEYNVTWTDDAAVFMQRCTDTVTSYRDALKTCQTKHREDDRATMASIDVLQSQLHRHQASVRALLSQRKALEKDRTRLQNSIKRIHVPTVELKEKEVALSSAQSGLAEAEKSSESLDLETKIGKSTAEKKALDDSVAELEQELSDVTGNAAGTAALVVMRTTLVEKRALLEQMWTENEAKFSESIGDVPRDIKALVSTLHQHIDRLKTDQNGANDQLRVNESAVSSLDGQLRSLRESISEIGTQINAHTKKLKKVTQGAVEEFPKLMEDAQKRLEALQNDLVVARSAGAIWHRFTQQAQDHHRCPACERVLDHEEMDRFEQLMAKQVKNVPQFTANIEKSIVVREKLHVKFVGLRPVFDDLRRLQEDELPARQARLEDIMAKKREADSELESCRAVSEAAAAHLEKAVELGRHADDMVSLNSTIDQLARQVAKEEEKLALTGSSRTSDIVQTELDQARAGVERLSAELGKLNAEQRARHTKVHNCEKAVLKLERELDHLRRSEHDRNELMKRLADIDDKDAILAADIMEKEKNVEPTQTEIQKIQNKRDKAQQSAQVEESAKQEELTHIQQGAARIRSVVEDIVKYRGDDELVASRQMVADAQHLLESLEQRRTTISAEIEGQKGLRSEKASTERQVTDNITHKQLSGKVATMKKDIETHSATLAAYEGESGNVTGELDALGKQMQALAAEIGQLQGQRGVYEEQLKSMTSKLSQGDLKDAQQKWKKKLIELRTTDMAVKDLEKYYHALERALMKYHSAKMEEINKIINELWKAVYRGTDIETIMITSDATKTANLDTGRGKSFNYRVVMVTGGYQLDMRGRCSAGQKVLASLIIRLALAETFCVQAGIIALDEPTTNLDEQNIRSFSEALAGIIKTRHQKNSHFQIVVITHDNAFAVELLQRVEGSDRFFVVKRMPGERTSVIEAHRVEDLDS